MDVLLAGLLVAALPTLTATVTIDPVRAQIEAQVRLRTHSEATAFGLHTDLEVRAMRVDGRAAPVVRNGRRVQIPADHDVELDYGGPLPRRGPDKVTEDAVVLVQRRWPWIPHLTARMDATVTVRLPEGWQVVGSGEPPNRSPTCEEGWCAHGPFVAVRQPFMMLVANRRWVQTREGDVRVLVAPERAAAAPRLLAAAQRMLGPCEARLGPRATRSLTIVEAPIDGGFTVHGLVAIHPGAVAAFADSDREEKLLVHELGHQWFGSVVAGHPWMTEGICRFQELWWLERTQGATVARAFEEELATCAMGARPGLSLEEIWYGDRWKDFEAVAYCRGALAHAALRKQIGPEAHDRFLRAHLALPGGLMPKLEATLQTLDVVAPGFDRLAFYEAWFAHDVDPRTGAPRPVPFVLDARVALGVAGLVFLFVAALALRPPRGRSDVLRLFAGGLVLGVVAFELWRGPGWVFGARPMIGLGGALVSLVAAWRGRARAGGAGLLVALGLTGGPIAFVVGAALALALAAAGGRR